MYRPVRILLGRYPESAADHLLPFSTDVNQWDQVTRGYNATVASALPRASPFGVITDARAADLLTCSYKIADEHLSFFTNAFRVIR